MATALEQEATTRRWRRVEYERLVDLGVFEGERLELLDGVLVVKERQGSAHAAVSGIVGQALDAAFGDGCHTRQHSPLALGDFSEPEPDVAVVAGEPLDYIAAHPSTASLVVEVADGSLRLDRRFKAAIYARAGLREYRRPGAGAPGPRADPGRGAVIVNLVDRAPEVHREPRAPAGAAEDWSYRSRCCGHPRT